MYGDVSISLRLYMFDGLVVVVFEIILLVTLMYLLFMLEIFFYIDFQKFQRIKICWKFHFHIDDDDVYFNKYTHSKEMFTIHGRFLWRIPLMEIYK